KCAASLGINIGHLDISAECDFDRRGVTLQEEIDVPFKRIVLRIEASEPVSESDLQSLAAEVAKFCPLAKLFRQAGTEINEEWTTK
ncbi:MAG: OsmC family protein, partial [Rhizobiaceae bacterium]